MNSPTPRPARVLVIDDDSAVRGLLEQALPLDGLGVVTAPGGAEGVELFRRDPAAVGAALVDVRMPGLDGPATVAALRAIDPTLPCCLMTGYAGPHDARSLRAAGVAAVVHKPFRLDELAATLRGLLAAGG